MSVELQAENREPITATCADCRWRDTCLADGTCWEAVRTEREQTRQERRAVARATPKDRKENAMEGLAELDAMDRGDRVNGSEPAATTCKVPGCDESWLNERGRFAKLCSEHKAEAVTKARAEDSLGKPASKPRATSRQPASSFAELAAEVERAQADVEQAKTRFLAATELLRDHPLYAETMLA